MEVINDPKELLNIAYKDNWQHRDKNPFVSSDYKALTYECGCGEDHILRDTDFTLIAPIVQFIFHCRNDFLTAVNVKGFFSQKAISKWSCTTDVFDKMEELKREMIAEMREADRE